jgi:hypothetical protein
MKILADDLRGVGFLCETVFRKTTGGDGLDFLILRRID